MFANKKLVLITFLSCLLAACSTVKGLGQDISKGGQAISKAASK